MSSSFNAIRRYGIAIAGVCVLTISIWLASAACAALDEAPEPTAHLSARPDAHPREMLALLGLDDEFFAGFSSDTPLSEAEQQKLLRILFRMRQISPKALADHARRALDVSQIVENLQVQRGEIFSLRFSVQRVRQLEVPADLRAAYGFDRYYECQVDAFGHRCLLYVRFVPTAWKLDQRIDEVGTAMAMFLKALPPGEDPPPVEHDDEPAASSAAGPPLLFVADRIAWHPPTLLGFLGMDYGLFDGVRDRAALTEREPFYQMLAITRQLTPPYLDTQIRKLLAQQRETLGRMVRNRDLPAKMRADAERGLERAEEGASDIVPLFNSPAEQRGQFVVIRGEALRAVKVRVDDTDINQRFGIDHYFEVEVVTPDSQNNPIVCCVSEVPPNMPLGNSIHESVRVAGFFFKSWAFDSRKSGGPTEPADARQRQLAPLIVGKRVELITQPHIGVPLQSLTLAGAIGIVFVICGAALWWIRHSDRRVRQQIAQQRGTLPERVLIDETPPAGGESA